MAAELITAAMALSDALARENAALTALDLARAAAMLGEKMAAAAAFSAAVQRARKLGETHFEQRERVKQVGTLLRDLSEENRRLLERAIFVQGRVLATIAKALPKGQAAAPRYGAAGTLTNARQTQAMTLSARA